MMKRDFRIAYSLLGSLCLVLAAALFAACKNPKTQPLREATLTVSLLLPDGSPAAELPVLLFDETGALDQDPFAAPLATLTTDKNGTVTYTLEVGRWFASRAQRELTFAVRTGEPGNYRLWSVTRSVRPGDALALELRLTADPSVPSEPSEPAAPSDPADPTSPTDLAEGGGADSGQPAEETETEEPVEEAAPEQPTPPDENPSEPATPEEKPETPGQPAEALLTGITLRQQPTKTTYNLGEPLDLTGLAVNGLYSDGSQRPLALDAVWVEGFTSAAAADALTLTVTYEGHQATFTVRVTPLRIEQGTLTEIQPVGGGELVLPEGITAVADRAAMFCDATHIVLPEGLRSIGEMAFYGAALTEVVLPSTLQSIGQEAFYRCTSLRRADLSRTTLTTLPPRLFANTGLEEVVWPATLTEIGRQAFLDTSRLTTLILPASLQTLALEAFRESAIQSITLPNTIRTVESRAFYLCSSLREVLTTGAVPAAPQGTLEGSCFVHCPALETLTLPEGLTTLGSNLLSGNTRVEAVHIPSAVTRIAFGAFDNTAIREVTVAAVTPPSVETVVGQWYGFPSGVAVIRVPAGSAEAYRTAEGWSALAGVIE
ncbi:MAG TPA: leucine-rich repeat protein [Candidatus Rikenella faecigallinarum]|uniref:Leucine-rich repeat protein n=1 Tax=Candidatus Rikenella faecigallinarum TaxID=2838745 RepID=A0A9D1QF14_9BACT|nr:leucine-rich repeat protein [Candidatus Rikenella faecigallinarum]